MLNKAFEMGRICNELELKSTASGVSVLSFTIAVDRDYKGSDGEKITDFLPCVAWRNQAEHIARWFKKGSLICIDGTLQSRSYITQEGQKRSAIEVLVEKVHFTGERKENSSDGNFEDFTPNNDIDNEDGLPF